MPYYSFSFFSFSVVIYSDKGGYSSGLEDSSFNETL